MKKTENLKEKKNSDKTYLGPYLGPKTSKG